jgi:hypothetical protein
MKKQSMIVLFVFLCLIFPLLAHPPSEINVVYDPATQLLRLDIIHPTSDVKNHHIKEVQVIINGEWFTKQEFSVQTESRKHQAVILLATVKPGDPVDIIAVCNVFGKKQVSTVIPEE